MCIAFGHVGDVNDRCYINSGVTFRAAGAFVLLPVCHCACLSALTVILLLLYQINCDAGVAIDFRQRAIVEAHADVHCMIHTVNFH